MTRRGTRVGAWPNWYLALSELYMREPYADAFFMLQDDVVLCRHVRQFLEQTLWCAPSIGLVSIYSPTAYGASENGFLQTDSHDGLMGALTYILPNASVRNLLSDSELLEHRLRGSSGLEGIDTVVGKWTHRTGLPVYLHSPSLAGHIGRTSTIWSNDSDDVRRSAASFVSEEFDAYQLGTE